MRWGLFFLLLLFFALVGYIGWIVYTQYRARQAGLPAPSWKSYIPFTSSSSTQYRDSSYPSPRRGSIAGWIKDRFAVLQNKRTAHGSYEGSLEAGALRGRGGERDEVWDARVGAETDGTYGPSGGFYEEQVLGAGPRHDPYSSRTAYSGAASRANVTAKPVYDEPDKGRGRGNGHEQPQFNNPGLNAGDTETRNLNNPFGDDAETSSLRDVSPRPEIERGNNKRVRDGSPGERRSVFREGL